MVIRDTSSSVSTSCTSRSPLRQARSTFAPGARVQTLGSLEQPLELQLDRAERRPQLVRGDGEELVAEPHRLLGVRQAQLLLLARGDAR